MRGLGLSMASAMAGLDLCRVLPADAGCDRRFIRRTWRWLWDLVWVWWGWGSLGENLYRSSSDITAEVLLG